VMLQSGFTIVGCCFRDAAHPALTDSEIMHRSATSFAKTTGGFISHFRDRE